LRKLSSLNTPFTTARGFYHRQEERTIRVTNYARRHSYKGGLHALHRVRAQPSEASYAPEATTRFTTSHLLSLLARLLVGMLAYLIVCRAGFRHGVLPSDSAAMRRIHFIYGRMLQHFKSDVPLWIEYAHYCLETKAFRMLGRALARSVAAHKLRSSYDLIHAVIIC